MHTRLIMMHCTAFPSYKCQPFIFTGSLTETRVQRRGNKANLQVNENVCCRDVIKWARLMLSQEKSALLMWCKRMKTNGVFKQLWHFPTSCSMILLNLFPQIFSEAQQDFRRLKSERSGWVKDWREFVLSMSGFVSAAEFFVMATVGETFN